MTRLALLLVAALLAGCTQPPGDGPRQVTVEPPADAGGFAECAPASALQMAVPFRAEALDDAGGRPTGLHRLNETAFLWVWAHYEETLREDRITRVNEVQVFREAFPEDSPRLVACTRVEVGAPTQVDAERRSYDVAALFEATHGMPSGELRFVVNWVAGCPCDPLPSGNVTAVFPDPPSVVSETA